MQYSKRNIGGIVIVLVSSSAAEKDLRRIFIVSCEIEDFVETRLCKLRGIPRSRVLRAFYRVP